MSHPIRILSGEPNFDRLPVLKLHCGTEVPINDRIFAQAQLGLCDSCFYARLWTFEVEPSLDSSMSLLLEGPTGSLRLRVSYGGSAALQIRERDHSELLSAYRILGEDLQGAYWGAVAMIPLDDFCAALGIAPPLRGIILRGNVYQDLLSQGAAFPESGEFILG